MTDRESEECISREAALKIFGDAHPMDYNTQAYITAIKNLPSVTPQPKSGRWITHPKGVYAHLVCSKCLTAAPYDCPTFYCPQCGAKMEEV